ncbi:MAG: hypothetical protein ACPGLV_08620 [Bacteroidia bacterium]
MKGMISAILLIFLGGQLSAHENGKFTTLEEALKNPTAVKELQLSNITEKLPKEIAEMVNLETVRLINLKSNYSLNNAFKRLAKYTKIKQLHLYGNKHKKLPKSLSEIKTLVFLRLSPSLRVDLENIFDYLALIEGFRELDLSGMNLESIPKNIANLNLTYLNLERNNISVEEAIDVASKFNLEELDLSWFKFNELPESITKLKSLKRLSLELCGGGFNNAVSFERLSKLPLLEELNLEGNFAGPFHENVKLLTQLDRLFISGNCMPPKESKKIMDWLPNTKVDNSINC